MKAVLFRHHGGPEVLEHTDFPTPEPKPGNALIRLHTAALNRMDVMVRNGWPGLKLEMPPSRKNDYGIMRISGRSLWTFIDPQDCYACETVSLV